MIHDVLSPLVILGTIAAGIVLFLKVLTDYKLKRNMIEKGFVDKDSQEIFRKGTADQNYLGSLKWALVIFFGGSSLVIMEFIPVKHDSTLPYGLFALMVSLGFLIYFFIARAKK